MRAEVGDELTGRGIHPGDEDRHGEITRVDGADGAPPYHVRWQDGRETVIRPGEFAFYDTPRPYELRFDDDFTQTIREPVVELLH